MQAARARIVFVMPRCRHDHVRGVHKQAWSLATAGHEVVLVVKERLVEQYLGMRVVAANAPFKSVLRPLMNLPAMYRQVRQLKGDVVILRNPDTIPLALLLRLLGHKVIYDTHEDFSKRPMIHPSLPIWARSGAAWLITRLERLLARTANLVIVTQLQQVQGIGGRTMLQPNAPLTTGPIVQSALKSGAKIAEGELSYIYAGEITRYRGVFAMLEMIQAVNRHHKAWLDIVGWIRYEPLLEQAKQHPGWRFVRFHGAKSHADALAHIKCSDIGVALLQPVGDYPTTSVTKLFEYMQFGIPFIASDFDAWKVSTELGSAGLYVNPDSIGEISDAAIRLAGDRGLRRRLGEAGRQYIETDFNWEQISAPYVDLVTGLIRGS